MIENAPDRAEAYTGQMWTVKILLTEPRARECEAVTLDLPQFSFSVASRVHVLIRLPCCSVYDDIHPLRPDEDFKLLLCARALVRDLKIIGQG